jgi:hypothetical protein
MDQIVQEDGVHPVPMSQWKKEIQNQVKKLFDGKRGPQPVSARSKKNRSHGQIGYLKIKGDLPTLPERPC